MAKIQIDRDRCKGCELCVVYCPKECIVLDRSLNKRGVHPARFKEDGAKCTSCSFCAIMCPDLCIEVYR